MATVRRRLNSPGENSTRTSVVCDQPIVSERRLGLCLVKHFLAASVILYFSLASVMYLSSTARKEAVFMNSLNTPFFANLSDPDSCGLTNTLNLFLEGNAGKIGAWFIPAMNGTTSNGAYLLYLHGNGGSRAVPHRVEAMKVLRQLDLNILIIDYRGFGDSDGAPSEQGVVEDAYEAYNWLRRKANGGPTYVWGHSLGSGVGIQLVALLSKEGQPPHGLIVEGAFTSIKEAAYCSALSQPYIFWPNFDAIFLEGIVDYFASDKRVTSVHCPILMMHEKSDPVIHFKLGEKLYQAANKRSGFPTTFIPVDEGLYHNSIHLYSGLKVALKEFVAQTST